MFPTEVPADPTIPGWLSFVLLGVGTVLGGGGITAFLKARWDRKAGVEAHEVSEDDAIASRWEALSKAQIEVLLDPLRARLGEVEAKVTALETELDASRKKYWTAIPYIRVLIALLHRHAPDVIPPSAPANIAEDI